MNMAEFGAVAEFQGLSAAHQQQMRRHAAGMHPMLRPHAHALRGLGKQATTCPSGYKKVNHPKQGPACITQPPCATNYRFNARQWACVPTKKAVKAGLVAAGNIALTTADPIAAAAKAKALSKIQLRPGETMVGDQFCKPDLTEGHRYDDTYKVCIAGAGFGVGPAPGSPVPPPAVTIDPNTGAPVTVDPTTGLPVVTPPPTGGIDPTTGLPLFTDPNAPPGTTAGSGMACAAGLVQDPATGICYNPLVGPPNTGSSSLYQCAPGSIMNPLTGQCSPGTGPTCAPGTVLNQFGQCLNPLTGQIVGMPSYGYGAGPLPFGGEPQGPSSLYPYGPPQQPSPYGGGPMPSYGGGGGFDNPMAPSYGQPPQGQYGQPQYGPQMQPSPYGQPPGASFDNVPGAADFSSDGSTDFIPDDAQAGLTAPGTPQGYPESSQDAALEIADSGGTDEAAYGDLSGLGADANTNDDAAKQFLKYRDIGLDTVTKIQQLNLKTPRQPAPVLVVDDPSAWHTPVLFGIGALLLYGLFRAAKKA